MYTTNKFGLKCAIFNINGTKYKFIGFTKSTLHTPIDYGNDQLKKLHFFVSNFPKIILDELLWCPMPSQGKNEIFFFGATTRFLIMFRYFVLILKEDTKKLVGALNCIKSCISFAVLLFLWKETTLPIIPISLIVTLCFYSLDMI